MRVHVGAISEVVRDVLRGQVPSWAPSSPILYGVYEVAPALHEADVQPAPDLAWNRGDEQALCPRRRDSEGVVSQTIVLTSDARRAQREFLKQSRFARVALHAIVLVQTLGFDVAGIRPIDGAITCVRMALLENWLERARCVTRYSTCSYDGEPDKSEGARLIFLPMLAQLNVLLACLTPHLSDTHWRDKLASIPFGSGFADISIMLGNWGVLHLVEKRNTLLPNLAEVLMAIDALSQLAYWPQFRPQAGHPAHGVLQTPQAWWPPALRSRVERLQKCFADAATGTPASLAPAKELLQDWQPIREPTANELCRLFPEDDDEEEENEDHVDADGIADVE